MCSSLPAVQIIGAGEYTIGDTARIVRTASTHGLVSGFGNPLRLVAEVASAETGPEGTTGAADVSVCATSI